MRQNDLLKSDAGDHLRVLLYGEQQSYVVNCQRCKMPFPISTSSASRRYISCGSFSISKRLDVEIGNGILQR